ncbi:MAG: hypothetical protein PQJ58_03850 [Spirochaetales bacterium]|nr:hypothetical protein [Spirochaetales bacterium]
MPKASLVLSLFFLFTTSLFSEILQTETIPLFHNSYELMHSMGAGREGSDEEGLIRDYIEDFLTAQGISYERQVLDDVEGVHSFSMNLIARVPGLIPDELIIAVPLDSDESQSHRALNPALALSFLNEWKNRTPPLSLVFLFTSGDNISREFLGSRNFLINYNFRHPAALIYLDMDNKAKLPELYGSMPFLNSPGWYMEDNRKALKDAALEYRIDSTALLINRAGLNTKSHGFQEFLQEDIPSAVLYSSSFDGPDISVNPSPYLQYLFNIVTSLGEGVQENWDNHYIYLGYGKEILFYINEQIVLLFFLTAVSLSLLFPLFQERKISLNFKRFRKQIWMAPVIIYLCFLFYMVTTLMLEELMIFLNYDFIQEYYPLYFFTLKVSGAILLSTLFINLMRGLPFPRNPHFYSYLAFIISLVNLMITLFISISFTPIMLLSLMFVFFFVSFRNKSLKILFSVLSVVPQITVLIFLYSRDYSTVYNFFIFSRIRGNWMLTFFTLPLICQISSLSFYHHHYDRSRQEARTAVMTFFIALVTAFMIYYSTQLDPHRRGYRQIVQLSDTLYLDRGVRELSLNSIDSIGSGQIIHNDAVIPLEDSGKSLRIQGDITRSYLEISWESREFLDRRLIDLTIESEIDPDEIRLMLESEDPLILYDCPYPYEIQPDLRSARIFIGINPPLPLNIPIVLSGNSAPDLLITAYKNDSIYDLVLDNKDMDIKKRTVIRKTIRFDDI